jgi:hypothetical protein
MNEWCRKSEYLEKTCPCAAVSTKDPHDLNRDRTPITVVWEIAKEFDWLMIFSIEKHAVDPQ